MANRTVKDAKSIKGTNPQYLIEKIIRTRIYDCQYWKEKCFALTAELLVDEAMVLDHVGGVFGGNIKPTPFLCLILKMLQIQPNKDIVIEFIKNQDYKYVRAIGAMYLRIVGSSVECYKYLEPLYNDYRKIKFKNRQGKIVLSHVDEFIDLLLREDRVCDVILPRIQKRHILEETEQLEPRVSALDEDLEGDESEEEEEEEEENRSPSPKHHSRHRSRSRSPRKRHSSRDRSPPHRKRSRSRSPRKRHHSRSPSPHSHRHKRRHSPSDRHRHSPNHSSRRKEDRHRDERRHKEERDDEKKDRGKEKKKHKDKERKSKSHKERTAEEEEEIRQANELRASLGMKPLRD